MWTEWSEARLDETRNQWYSRRRNEEGEEEFCYYQQDTAGITPRGDYADERRDVEETISQPYYASPGAESSSATAAYSTSSNDGNAYGGASPIYTTSRAATSRTSTYPSADYHESSALSFYPNPSHVGQAAATSSLSQYGESSQAPTSWAQPGSASGGFNDKDLRNTDYGGTDAVTTHLASGMEAMSLRYPTTTAEQVSEATDTWQRLQEDAKLITKASKRSEAERLDPRYQTVPDKDHSRFWRLGRVFMVLWTEPADSTKVAPGGGTRNGSHYSTTWLNGDAYSEIRRFVVVRAGHGSSQCSPIQTYSGQATLKRNLPDRLEHAVIYTSKYPPDECSYPAVDGTLVGENLTKDPIKVDAERGSSLDPRSRLNYNKIYLVEHYVRVLNIGIVAKDCLQSLEANCPLRPLARPSKDPGTLSPPTHRGKKDSKEKSSSSKGKDKSSEHDRKRHHRR